MADEREPRQRGQGTAPSDATGDEDEERVRYRELLEELRTIIPGVQVLFAFLLTAPFSERFADLDDLGRGLYAGALLGVAVATVVFVTPAALHRLGDGVDRTTRLKVGVRCTVVGMTLMAASVVTSVFVVVRFVFAHTAFAAVLAAVVGASAVGLWYVLPQRYRTGG